MNTDVALDESLDGTIDVALQNADINALRMALYQATGDESLLEMGVGRTSVWGRSWQVTALTPDDEKVVREKCRAYLRGLQAASSDVAAPADDQYRRMINAFAGEDVPDSVVRWGKEELAFGDQSRLVNWRKSMAADTLSSFHAIIIGAGMSGIAMALQFKNLGLPFTIIERQGDVGGTWSLNTYPGARVDVASHHYEFSFRRNHPWKHYFAAQQDLLQYLKECCDDYGLMEHVKLRTEITSAAWNAADGKWDIVLAGVGDGAREEIKANVVISAAGVFHTPNLPDIEGIDTFKGD
ncbi:MAG: NAD(P)/FAD-dependent oxidoreductase, partial [Hyphomicrobiales bacterium]